ncbi:hypothetical protein [Alkalicoccus luteus]|uniref:hypothetical protein n=1 Tax=Alkalicoccus luteus TaxID=1237094 RepID=UPI0040337478
MSRLLRGITPLFAVVMIVGAAIYFIYTTTQEHPIGGPAQVAADILILVVLALGLGSLLFAKVSKEEGTMKPVKEGRAETDEEKADVTHDKDNENR